MKNLSVFIVYDEINEEIMLTASAKNEKMAVRNLYGSVGSFAPIKDMSLYKVGEMNAESGELIPGKKEKIDWDIYKFPQNKAECLAPSGTTKENKALFEKACEGK